MGWSYSSLKGREIASEIVDTATKIEEKWDNDKDENKNRIHFLKQTTNNPKATKKVKSEEQKEDDYEVEQKFVFQNQE